MNPTTRRVCSAGFIIGLLLVLFSFQTYFNGPHKIRQAASVYTGYFFCTTETNILYPRIGALGPSPQEVTPAIAINEFPLYAYTLGMICRAKGSWDEVTPRFVSIVFALLAGFLFWISLQQKFGLKSQDKLLFLTVFSFLPVLWTFFTIPMPESTALLLYAAAGALWTRPKRSLGLDVVAGVLFCIGFLVRPYYILFLFFYFPGVIQVGVVLTICIGLFWFWFRYWNSQVTTNFGYFGIQFQTTAQILKELPNAIAHLPTRVLEHTAVVGLFAFYLARKKYLKLILFYGASIGMMYVLKSTHIADHGYYLMSAGVFASFIVYLGLREAKAKWQPWLVAGLLVYTFIDTQHNFRANRELLRLEPALKEFGPIPKDAVFATHMGHTSAWLYYLKVIGWEMPHDHLATCPPRATHFLMDDESSKVKIGLCKDSL